MKRTTLSTHVQNGISSVQRHPYLALITVLFLIITVTGAHVGALEWDEGSFLLNAEYFAGTDTNLEQSRPHALSYAISLIWQVTGESTVAARLLVVLFGAATIFVFHRITATDNTISHPLLLTAAYALSPLLLYWSFHAYTDVPAFLFVLGALYAYKTGRHLVAGALLAVAGTMRYVFLVFAVGMAVGYVLEHRHVLYKYAAGGVLGALPFFTYSWLAYDSPLARIRMYVTRVTKWSGSGLFATTAGSAWAAVSTLSTLIPGAALGWRDTPTVEKSIVLSYAAFFLFFSGNTFTRYWLPMVPFLLLMTDRGVTRYSDQVSLRGVTARTAIAVIAGGMLLTSGIVVGSNFAHLQTCAGPFNDAIAYVQDDADPGNVVSDNWAVTGYLLDRDVHSPWTDYDTLRSRYDVRYAVTRADLPYETVYTAENTCGAYYVYDLEQEQPR